MGKGGFYAWQDVMPWIHRKPLRVLLSELYAEHGTLQGVADALEISRSTLHVGMRKKELTLKLLQGE
jgi:transcriptional regulator of acetoin/glycerol metabolism